VRQDQIDILIDLSLHSAGHRLLVFARKPAPVQVTYLGYCSTSGLDTIDYRISDLYLDPPEANNECFSEKTIYLPRTYWCYQPEADAPQVTPLPAQSARRTTFGCLNDLGKVTQPTLNLWGDLLRAVPGSQLLIYAPQGEHRQRIGAQIDPDRVQFVAHLPLQEYLATYNQIDIGLDPFPFNGGTTTCDALWMGVPVVSLVGTRPVSRAGLSILSNVGLPELVARSEDDYVKIAVELANDLPRLSELRSSLRQRMLASPLTDARQFARDIEAAYRQMWQAWCTT
jgi:predicted O-linked N-acetylglucosamine transferase (SPINDLY family)